MKMYIFERDNGNEWVPAAKVNRELVKELKARKFPYKLLAQADWLELFTKLTPTLQNEIGTAVNITEAIDDFAGDRRFETSALIR